MKWKTPCKEQKVTGERSGRERASGRVTNTCANAFLSHTCSHQLAPRSEERRCPQRQLLRQSWGTARCCRALAWRCGLPVTFPCCQVVLSAAGLLQLPEVHVVAWKRAARSAAVCGRVLCGPVPLLSAGLRKDQTEK